MALATTAATTPFLPLERLAVTRPWGGRRVGRRFGWDVSRDVGEWWLASGYPGSVTPVASGPGLDEWLDEHGKQRGLPAACDFPLLVKFLDADADLSVQVHPDDAVARGHGLARGKTEAWHVIDAEPGAQLYIGLIDGVTPELLFETIEAGATSDEIRGLLRSVPARAGDTWLIEAGTIHAVGAGVAIFEVQQNSDATYRIFDWERQPARELHIQAARESARDVAPVTPCEPTRSFDGWNTFVDGDCFRLARASVTGRIDLVPRGSFATLTVLAGVAMVASCETSLSVAAGETVILLEPTSISGDGVEVITTEPAV